MPICSSRKTYRKGYVIKRGSAKNSRVKGQCVKKRSSAKRSSKRSSKKTSKKSSKKSKKHSRRSKKTSKKSKKSSKRTSSKHSTFMDVIRWTQIKAILGASKLGDAVEFDALQQLNLQNIFTEFIKHVSREYLEDNAIDILNDLNKLSDAHGSTQLDNIAEKIQELLNTPSMSIAQFRKDIPNVNKAIPNVNKDF